MHSPAISEGPRLKHRPGLPDSWGMPTLLAIASASAAGWFSESALRPLIGGAGAMLASLVASTLVYLYAKHFFVDLRDGR